MSYSDPGPKSIEKALEAIRSAQRHIRHKELEVAERRLRKASALLEKALADTSPTAKALDSTNSHTHRHGDGGPKCCGYGRHGRHGEHESCCRCGCRCFSNCNRNGCTSCHRSGSHNGCSLCVGQICFPFSICPATKPIQLRSQKFFTKMSAGTHFGGDVILPASGFVDDNGNLISSFPASYEYVTLYINGVIQQNGVFTVAPSALVISGGATLDGDDPVTLEFVVQP